MERVSGEHLGVHHAGDELFRGTRPEPLDEVADGADGEAAGGSAGFVNERFSVEAVGQVTAGLQAAENGADAGVFQAMLGQQVLADLVGGGGAVVPDEVEDGLLELGEGAGGSVTARHVTKCNTCEM